MRDTPLPDVGDPFEVKGVEYIVAGGYQPPSWADGHAKLSLVDFEARTILLVAVMCDRAGNWKFRAEIAKVVVS
jgi:hypothetical protein